MTQINRWFQKLAVAILAGCFSLITCRLLFEAAFPQALWAGQFGPVLGLTLVIAIASTFMPLDPLALLPLLLNVPAIYSPVVNLVASRFLYGASLWLTAVLHLFPRLPTKYLNRAAILALLAFLAPVYWLTMGQTVGRADTFEFQVVAPKLGIVHPTGYPLYLLLGKLFTLWPWGSVAWRLNSGTAVYALAAVCLLYLILREIEISPIPALLTAVTFGLTPTFWSQAIEAEVYTLHALLTAATLYSLLLWQNQKLPRRLLWLIPLLIGLGLTNHLTTVFLLPPAGLTLLWLILSPARPSRREWGQIVAAFLAPLLLYAYLPLRWAAVNGEPMGGRRFLEWVIGGRFQGALQLWAWWRDPSRYAIVGRLFGAEWGVLALILAGVGFLLLLRQRPRTAVILGLAWLGFTFYALNYYVPDLAVFLIPAHLLMAIALGVAFQATTAKAGQFAPAFWLLLTTPVWLTAVSHYHQLDRSHATALSQWGAQVLALPLADHAALLADSEKIAPLYYLQQAEGQRPDLDIMVLPDEAAYRAELDQRIAAGQTVYLARFLPGLEGIYHLRSVGPLLEVSPQPLETLPATATPSDLAWEAIHLLGYEWSPVAGAGETAVTLYWQAETPIPQTLHVYLRWQGGKATPGQHPANNFYPTPAWKPGEIITDYHLLTTPITQDPTIALQVALAPPFTPPDQMAWQTLVTIPTPPAAPLPATAMPIRVQVSLSAITAVTFPTQVRPNSDFTVTIQGFGERPDYIDFTIQPINPVYLGQIITDHLVPPSSSFFVQAQTLTSPTKNDRYLLITRAICGVECPVATVCGWLQSLQWGCVLGEIEVSGVPLPDGAVNFEDKIALLSMEMPQMELTPGGQLPLMLHWQSLAPMSEDYTVFIQLLDAQGKLVTQIDSWPLQGTFPTSQWRAGQKVDDAYTLAIPADLPPGPYSLQVGWYLLATSRRLPVLSADGLPTDDRFLREGLFIP